MCKSQFLILDTTNILGQKIFPWGSIAGCGVEKVCPVLVGFLAAALAPTHWMPVTTSPPLQLWQPKVSADMATCWGKGDTKSLQLWA